MNVVYMCMHVPDSFLHMCDHMLAVKPFAVDGLYASGTIIASFLCFRIFPTS